MVFLEREGFWSWYLKRSKRLFSARFLKQVTGVLTHPLAELAAGASLLGCGLSLGPSMVWANEASLPWLLSLLLVPVALTILAHAAYREKGR